MITDVAISLDNSYQDRLQQYNAAPSPVSLRRVSKLGILLLEEINENCTANDPEERRILDEVMESMLVTGNMLHWVLQQAARNSGIV